MSETVLVDTNVAVVANDAVRTEPLWPVECVIACLDAIESVMAGGRIVAVDALGGIVAEYFDNLSLAGQPGLGDQFAKWIHDHQWRTDKCVQVAITPDGDTFFELPPELSDLVDPSDRKFVAVSIAHGNARIIEATDSKWWGWTDQLARAGVEVDFVCPTTIEALFMKKMG